MIKLVIFSDPVCPWCYIGKSRLGRALEARPDHPFTLEWHPFMLEPGMPAEGIDRAAYLEAKFGGRDGVVAAHKPIVEEAEATGLALDLAAITRSPSTLDAHRLLHWAALEHRQTPVASALFRAYWAEGRDISDHDTLADIAAAQGMDRAVVARLLASGADADDIRARDADARAKGVRAVPTYVIDNQYVVEGAQPTELWLRVIDEIAAKAAAERAEPGPAC